MVSPRDTSDARSRLGRVALGVGGVLSVAGTVVFVLSALTMVGLWITLFFRAMGWLGLVLGVTTSPVAVAYPFLHWFARGEFPVVVFVIWLSGIVGMVASMAWAVWGRPRASRIRAFTPIAAAPVVVELRANETSRD